MATAAPTPHPTPDPRPTPLVRVVVLNFDGGDMTLDCLDSILASDWPADRLDVVMVDNGSLDHVVEAVTADDRYRAVTVLEPLENLGFAGGCNLGIRLTGDHDYVALVNNDATVAPGWLRAMVGAAERDETIGAVSAKMLFADRYHGIDVEVPEASVLVPREGRVLGVRVSGVRLDGERVDDRIEFDERFHGDEPPHEPDGEEIARWSSSRGALRVAAAERTAGSPGPSTLSVRLSCPVRRTATLRSGVHTVTATVGPRPQWVDVAIPPEPFDVINNAGSNLFAGGFGGDRGFLEPDLGQYEEPADVFAWCGGAVLLRRRYLDDVGCFDERLFLYYEDTDLSWRGRARGWRYVYEPRALVRHRHASSSGVGSPTFRFYTERNRLLVLAKNAPAPLALRAGFGEVERAVSVAVRHYVVRPLTLRLPVRAEVAHRWRVCRSFLALLPGMLRDRWAPGRTVDRSQIMRWEVVK
jgi:GT2 family glycosyltransferase